MKKLNSIDLFSGYAGITEGLKDYVSPIIYCDIERFSQAILLSRMDDGSIPFAPIWGDVRTLDGIQFKGLVDLIKGGFPCQDISVAGAGRGLEGERSGLFGQIIRLAEESEPTFIFLENVPAIRTRGADEVQERLSSIGYDARWIHLSAEQVGANHRRERWFCLSIKRDRSNLTDLEWVRAMAHADRVWKQSKQDQRILSPNRAVDGCEDVANTSGERLEGQRLSGRVPTEVTRIDSIADAVNQEVADPDCSRLSREATTSTSQDHEGVRESDRWSVSSATNRSWWEVEPLLGRVADGVKDRTHRVKALGNGVVPLQVKTAFEKLMGIIPL